MAARRNAAIAVATGVFVTQQPPDCADAHGAVIRAENPRVCTQMVRDAWRWCTWYSLWCKRLTSVLRQARCFMKRIFTFIVVVNFYQMAGGLIPQGVSQQPNPPMSAPSESYNEPVSIAIRIGGPTLTRSHQMADYDGPPAAGRPPCRPIDELAAAVGFRGHGQTVFPPAPSAWMATDAAPSWSRVLRPCWPPSRKCAFAEKPSPCRTWVCGCAGREPAQHRRNARGAGRQGVRE